MVARKKGMLTKVETAYIISNLDKLTTQQIAKDLRRSVIQIADYIKRKKLVQPEFERLSKSNIETAETSRPKTAPTHTKSAKNRNVTVMTETLSELGDVNRQSSRRRDSGGFDCIAPSKR